LRLASCVRLFRRWRFECRFQYRSNPKPVERCFCTSCRRTYELPWTNHSAIGLGILSQELNCILIRFREVEDLSPIKCKFWRLNKYLNSIQTRWIVEFSSIYICKIAEGETGAWCLTVNQAKRFFSSENNYTEDGSFTSSVQLGLINYTNDQQWRESTS